MQLESPPEIRGRVMAFYFTIVMGGTPLGSPIIGWVGQHLGARWTFVLGGVLTMAGVLVALAVYARMRGGVRKVVDEVLHEVEHAGNLFPRVWDNQAVARARTQGDGSPDSDTQVPNSLSLTNSR